MRACVSVPSGRNAIARRRRTECLSFSVLGLEIELAPAGERSASAVVLRVDLTPWLAVVWVFVHLAARFCKAGGNGGRSELG